MRKDRPHVFDRYEAGEDVSGAEMVAATAYNLVVGLVVAFLQWVGCLVAVILAFAFGGFILGIPTLIAVLWWAVRQAARGLQDFRSGQNKEGV